MPRRKLSLLQRHVMYLDTTCEYSFQHKWIDGWNNENWRQAHPTHCKQLNLFPVAKVMETVALSSTSNALHKKSSTSIVVSTQQPLTMTTIATTVTPSSNSNLPAAVSSTPMKKQRPKTASPTRHGGPQQCQVIFHFFLISLWEFERHPHITAWKWGKFSKWNL